MKILITLCLLMPLITFAAKPLKNNVTIEVGRIKIDTANLSGGLQGDIDSNFILGLTFERIFKRKKNFLPFIFAKGAYAKYNRNGTPGIEDVYHTSGHLAGGARYFLRRKATLVAALNYEKFYQMRIQGNKTSFDFDSYDLYYGQFGVDYLLRSKGDSSYSFYVGGLLGADSLSGSEITLRLFRKRQTYTLFKKTFRFETDLSEQDVSKFGFSYGYAF